SSGCASPPPSNRPNSSSRSSPRPEAVQCQAPASRAGLPGEASSLPLPAPSAAPRDMDPIYLDNNATTTLLPPVVAAMRPFHEGSFGNPASAHRLGRQARQALEDARESVASLLGAHAEEVVFTSGATESNNLALQGSGVRGQGSGDDP